MSSALDLVIFSPLRNLEELAQLGGDPARLGRHLETLIQAYDIEAVHQLIEAIRHD